MRARFWIYWNGGPCRLTLRQGESVQLFRSERTDEGFSSREENYRLDGDRVECFRYDYGRDCDGQVSTESHESARVDRLNDVWNDYAQVFYPAWETERRRHGGAHAESMGDLA